MSAIHWIASACSRVVTASLSRSGAHHGARSLSTSVKVSWCFSSHRCSSSRARSTTPWCRSSRTASVTNRPRIGAIGSSRNRGTSTDSTNSSMCSSLTLPRPIAAMSVTSWTTRRACAGSLAHVATRWVTWAAPTRSRMMSSWRKFSPTKSWSPLPSSSLRRGISAVCGIGRPSGCRNSAVTANQSAIAPTMLASAPALTKPSQPSAPSVSR